MDLLSRLLKLPYLRNAHINKAVAIFFGYVSPYPGIYRFGRGRVKISSLYHANASMLPFGRANAIISAKKTPVNF